MSCKSNVNRQINVVCWLQSAFLGVLMVYNINQTEYQYAAIGSRVVPNKFIGCSISPSISLELHHILCRTTRTQAPQNTPMVFSLNAYNQLNFHIELNFDPYKPKPPEATGKWAKFAMRTYLFVVMLPKISDWNWSQTNVRPMRAAKIPSTGSTSNRTSVAFPCNFVANRSRMNGSFSTGDCAARLKPVVDVEGLQKVI